MRLLSRLLGERRTPAQPPTPELLESRRQVAEADAKRENFAVEQDRLAQEALRLARTADAAGAVVINALVANKAESELVSEMEAMKAAFEAIVKWMADHGFVASKVEERRDPSTTLPFDENWYEYTSQYVDPANSASPEEQLKEKYMQMGDPFLTMFRSSLRGLGRNIVEDLHDISTWSPEKGARSLIIAANGLLSNLDQAIKFGAKQLTAVDGSTIEKSSYETPSLFMLSKDDLYTTYSDWRLANKPR